MNFVVSAIIKDSRCCQTWLCWCSVYSSRSHYYLVFFSITHRLLYNRTEGKTFCNTIIVSPFISYSLKGIMKINQKLSWTIKRVEIHLTHLLRYSNDLRIPYWDNQPIVKSRMFHQIFGLLGMYFVWQDVLKENPLMGFLGRRISYFTKRLILGSWWY